MPSSPGMTLAEMVAACRFQYAEPHVTDANFPSIDPVADVADMLTVSQKDLGGKDMTTAEIEAAIDRQGYRPATLADLLVYAKDTWSGKDHVFALASSWMHRSGRRYIPYLSEIAVGRGLYLLWDDPAEDGWSMDYRFLVIRK